jgi:uncharacterized delta-60 repeat protein
MSWPHAMTAATLHRAVRFASVAAAYGFVLLAPDPARCGSLTVRDAAGDQWRAISDPADGAQGYVLEHLGADGRLDPHFGHGGRRPLTISATEDAPTALRVDDGGRIWASGASIAGGQPQVVILRYLPDGAPDLRWGVQGKVQVVPGGLAIKPNDLLPLADGSLLVAGVAANVEPTRAVVFHLAADGSLDLSFGTRGTWQRTDAAQDLTATSLAVGDGGAVAACVVARGDHPAAEIWSLAMPTPKLIEQQALEPGRDGEDMRVAWSGTHWAFGTGNAPTLAGLRATLDPAGLAAEHAAASAPSDPGQGGFSPFASDGAVPSSTAGATADARSPSDTLVAAGVALVAIVAVIVSLRMRRRRT